MIKFFVCMNAVIKRMEAAKSLINYSINELRDIFARVTVIYCVPGEKKNGVYLAILSGFSHTHKMNCVSV